ncbi:hypothetical protein [Okeania sp. SIO1I7]|uniref:hypothetical protein n=1 Tax=Okeania sp. SIO1I7 TaxID=2607772 RepID=UPI0013F96783|nr:hypothetical protein [Okeania sp. SIO1I7]NET25522.1 hypothetical protein [Okeania sp. SIO1I7]
MKTQIQVYYLPLQLLLAHQTLLNLSVKDPINTFKKLLLGWYAKLDKFEQKAASNVDKTSWEKLKNLSPDLEDSIREIERLLKFQN